MLWFIIGLWVGALCGALAMALCKISAISDLTAENILLRSKMYGKLSYHTAR